MRKILVGVVIAISTLLLFLASAALCQGHQEDRRTESVTSSGGRTSRFRTGEASRHAARFQRNPGGGLNFPAPFFNGTYGTFSSLTFVFNP